MANKTIQVAVAIVIKPNGAYLLASRPDGKGWAGWWEFPGGKIERGEKPQDALTRELQEELGITPKKVQAWMKRRYDYPATHDDEAKTVVLHFYFVDEWQHEPEPLEGQQLAWQHPQQLNVTPVLPANAPIMHALSLPEVYAVNHKKNIDEIVFFEILHKQLKQGLRLLQMSEMQIGKAKLAVFIAKVCKLAKQYDARVLMCSSVTRAKELGVDGVHLSNHDLLQLKKKPKGLLVAASCHNASELAHAQALSLDFVTLTLEQVASNELGMQALNWQVFADLLDDVTIPVYAFGVSGKADLPQALLSGARGIAI